MSNEFACYDYLRVKYGVGFIDSHIPPALPDNPFPAPLIILTRGLRHRYQPAEAACACWRNFHRQTILSK